MHLRFFIFLILLSLYLHGEETRHFCVKKSDVNSSMICEEVCIVNTLDTIDTKIKKIQSQLRDSIEQIQEGKETVTLILHGKGFEGTLLAIAQNNLLSYYRKYIDGMILDDVPSDIDSYCHFDLEGNATGMCNEIKRFHKTLGAQASLQEVSHALSPALQVDWYWPPVLIRSAERDSQYQKWIEALDENHIVHFEDALPSGNKSNRQTLTYFYEKVRQEEKICKHQNAPRYCGPLLRFHLNKILYAPIRPVQTVNNISYGDSKEQVYDLYYDEKNRRHKLMIYVHGGGWSKGDKAFFSDLCKQYANSGYTAVALNYRLLNLPKVGMKEMVDDVKRGLEVIIDKYAKDKSVVVMGESAGGQLLFMALSKMSNKKIKAVILNSAVADFHKYSEKKQKRLSGISDHKKRNSWLNTYSPLSNLKTYTVPTLALQSLDDKVVVPSHLKSLDVKSVIFHKNITPFWVSNAAHPLSPKTLAMQPSYRDMERKINAYIYAHLK